MTLKELWQLVNAATGFDYTKVSDLELVGERISTLARLFNVREGYSRAADTLPARNLLQPLSVGSGGSQVVDLEPMLDEYYRIMGWTADGEPTRDRLKELGLLDSLGEDNDAS
jgi:aldehyde:ferredoxin oxidoreductase